MRKWLLAVFVIVLGAFCATLYYVNRVPPGASRVVDRIDHGNGKGELVLLSEIYTVENYYQSMEGPHSNQAEISIAENLPKDETIYLTSVRTDIFDAKSDKEISPQYFCHGNLTLAARSTNPQKHQKSFNGDVNQGWRMFTLVPGKMDIKLPEGFGIPIKAGTKIDYFTMALNQNADLKPGDIRFKTSVGWSKESEDITPVFFTGATIYQQHQKDLSEEERKSLALHVGQLCGAECKDSMLGTIPSFFKPTAVNHPGATCCVENASEGGVLKQFGNNNTIHWMVPPGRFTYKTDISKQLKLPFDTTAHYVTGHVHPFAEYMVLTDLDTGEEVFRIESEDYEGQIGVKVMSEIISKEGIWMKKDGNYELSVSYNNTTDRPIDVMAIIYLYLSEKPGKQPVVSKAN